LIDVLVIAVCAVLGEAESFEDIALYGRCKRAWLEGFLELPNGIPSHDTFRRVLMLVDPEAFERCFLGWVRAVFRSDEDVPRQIAIDGKTVRGSFDRKHGRSPLHLVSAYATEHGLVLAQRAAEEKKGELTVLPELLDGLDLRGCLVSLDALACRPEIAQQIVGRGGDYLITLKGNQKKVHAEVRNWFAANAFALGAPLCPLYGALPVKKDRQGICLCSMFRGLGRCQRRARARRTLYPVGSRRAGPLSRIQRGRRPR
ncbi:MAG TPA: ISAs1 family transposase, partial [Azospirillaceae bacterium]|nr:ISAs1 family transposase [Azospirillaceae bacterium]